MEWTNASMASESTNMSRSCDTTDASFNMTFECVSYSLRVFHGLFMSLVLIASLAGNITVLALVGSNRKLRTTTILVSLGLVVADILVAIIWVFQSVASTIAGEWPFGHSVCSFFSYIFVTVLYVRWCEVLAFTIDRLFHIIFPFFYNRHAKKMVALFTVLAWTVPALVSLPAPILLGYSSYYLSVTACSINCGENHACSYGITSAFGFFITIGGVVPTVIYFIIYTYGRKKKWEMDQMLRMGSISGQLMAEQPRAPRFYISTQARRTLTTCFAVFLITIITNIPIYLTSALRSQHEIYNHIPISVHFIVTYIFLFGPVLDPIIVMRNRDFWEVIYKHYKRRKAQSFNRRVTNVLALSVISGNFFNGFSKSSEEDTNTNTYSNNLPSPK